VDCVAVCSHFSGSIASMLVFVFVQARSLTSPALHPPLPSHHRCNVRQHNSVVQENRVQLGHQGWIVSVKVQQVLQAPLNPLVRELLKVPHRPHSFTGAVRVLDFPVVVQLAQLRERLGELCNRAVRNGNPQQDIISNPCSLPSSLPPSLTPSLPPSLTLIIIFFLTLGA